MTHTADLLSLININCNGQIIIQTANFTASGCEAVIRDAYDNQLYRLKIEGIQVKRKTFSDKVAWYDKIDIQSHWNHWPRRGDARYRHESLCNAILRRHGLETECIDCGCVMATALEHIDCEVCGSRNTASPYYN